MKKSEALNKLHPYIQELRAQSSRMQLSGWDLATEVLDFCVNTLGMLPPARGVVDGETICEVNSWEPEDDKRSR